MDPDSAGPAGPAARRWSATSTTGRTMLGLAALLVVVSALIAVQAARLPRRHEVRTVQGPVAAAVDAAGCPVGARCRAGSTAPPGILASIRRAFPQSQLTMVAGVYDAASGRPFRITVLASLGADTALTLIAQRLPGSPIDDPASFDSSGRSHTDLQGDLVIESQTLRAVVPGLPGCMLSLTVTASGGDNAFDGAALVLARDPKAQLQP